MEMMDPIYPLLDEYGRAYRARETDPQVQEARQALEDAQRRLKAVSEIHDTRLKRLEEMIKGHIMEREESLKHNGVYARYTKGHERVTWDNKRMTTILMKNPALLEILAEARKVTLVSPRVSIKVEEPEPAVGREAI